MQWPDAKRAIATTSALFASGSLLVIRIVWIVLGTPLQRRAIRIVRRSVVAARGWLMSALSRLRPLGTGAQRGPVFVGLVVAQLIAVLDAAQARLHGIEFRGGHNVLLAGRQYVANFFLYGHHALWRGRVGREELRHRPWLPFLLRLDLFEERHEGVRVIASGVHILQAQVVRLEFVSPGKLQEGHGNGEVEAFIKAVTRPAAWAQQDQRNRGHLCQLALGGVLGAVPRGTKNATKGEL